MSQHWRQSPSLATRNHGIILGSLDLNLSLYLSRLRTDQACQASGAVAMDFDSSSDRRPLHTVLPADSLHALWSDAAPRFSL